MKRQWFVWSGAMIAIGFAAWVGCSTSPTGGNGGTGGDDDGDGGAGATGPKIITVAGTGYPGNNGDGRDALDTQFYYPVDMEFSPAGELHVVDWNNHRIRRLNADNTFETLVGTGELSGELQEEGIAKEAKLNHPTNIYFEENGDILIAAWHNSQITRTTMSMEGVGEVMNNVIAGTGGREFCCDGDLAKKAKFNLPSSMVKDSSGNIIVADQANQRIRQIDGATGIVETICNEGGTAGYNGDNVPAISAKINLPAGQSSAPSGRIAIDGFDNIYLADTQNHRVRMIDGARMITTLVGTGDAGFEGDGGLAINAQLNTPSDVWVNPEGTLMYIADTYNHAVRKVDLVTGIITTVAGVLGERPTDADGDAFLSSAEVGDGGVATLSHLDRPFGVCVSPNGDIYIADTHNSRIRRVTTDVVEGPVDQGTGEDEVEVIPCSDEIGSICTYAGIGQKGFNGDAKHRTQTMLYWPLDMEFTPTGRIYVNDWNNHKMREILPDETFVTRIGNEFIGDGPPDYSDLYPPPGAVGTSVNLNHISDFVELPDETLVVTVWHNHKIRLYYPETGLVEVAIGDYPTYVDNTDGYKARLNLPSHTVLDSKGNLIFNDQKNWRFRVAENFAELKSLAPVRSIAGNGTHANYVEGTPLAEASFGWPGGPNPEPAGGLVIHPENDLLFYWVENESHSIWMLEFTDEQWSDGTITRVAGTGTEGFADGPALEAQFNWPSDMEMGPDGNLYVNDVNNFCVRKIDLTTGVVSTVVGTPGEKGYDGDGGMAIDAKLDRAFGIAFDAEGDLYVSDTFNGRIRVVNLNLASAPTDTQ